MQWEHARGVERAALQEELRRRKEEVGAGFVSISMLIY
jgi:hypothetical protein